MVGNGNRRVYDGDGGNCIRRIWWWWVTGVAVCTTMGNRRVHGDGNRRRRECDEGMVYHTREEKFVQVGRFLSMLYHCNRQSFTSSPPPPTGTGG